MKLPLSIAISGLFLLFFPSFEPAAQNWAQTSAPVSHWSSVASSADGHTLVSGAYQNGLGKLGGLFISTNSGATWADTSPAHNDWMAVASSADGTTLVAVEGYYGGGFIYVSTNSGTTW